MVTARAKRCRASAGLAVVIGCLAAVAACSSPDSASDSGNFNSPLQGDYVRVIHHVLPSVVEITSPSSTGSGIVFDSKGDIVTNAHVVGKEKKFEVSTSIVSKPLTAKVVGVFGPDDLAVIRVTTGADELRPVKWADSSKAQVGEIVLAMGAPYGLIDSVTQGIVSATGRTVTGAAEHGLPPPVITDAIQTSAAINPGNSGGALVTLGSEVIGINSLAARDPEMGNAADGIGFAIPSNTARDIASQLISNGKVTKSDRASLEITGRTSTDPQGTPDGVNVVAAQPGGAAANAGIAAGDDIFAVNGKPTPNLAQLENTLIDYRPGEKVTVEFRHNKTKEKVTVTLGTLAG